MIISNVLTCYPILMKIKNLYLISCNPADEFLDDDDDNDNNELKVMIMVVMIIMIMIITI